jgi:hypothetical protein
MRDYIQQFYTQDSMPVFQFVTSTFYFFNTAAECDSYVASYAGSSPGGGTLTPTAPIWFRMDKKIINSWLNSMGVQNLGPAVVAGDEKQIVFTESPRKFGVNSYQEKRVPVSNAQIGVAKKSDFSGAQGLITFLNNLPMLAAQLKKDGKVREAGIVLFAYNQVISDKWSITTMLQYLRDNRITFA